MTDKQIASAIARRSQKRFNKDHATPSEYSEGEYLVLGNQYYEGEADNIIKEFLTDNKDYEDVDIKATVDSCWKDNFGVSKYDDVCYCLGSCDFYENLWEGWVFEVFYE